MSAAAELESLAWEIIHPEAYARHGYPHETFRRLRAESPIRHFDDTPIPFWGITKHAHVTEIGRSPELFRNSPLLIVNPMYRRAQEDLPFVQIGRARVGKECLAWCRSRWSPYH